MQNEGQGFTLKRIQRKRPSTLKTWMDIAVSLSAQSDAPDKQVGAVAIDAQRNVLGYGYNYCVDEHDTCTVDEDGRTKDTTIHAEIELIHRAMDSGKSLNGATLFINYSPCLRCAAQLKRAKVKRIYFMHDFKNGQSHDFLLRHGIELIQVVGLQERDGADGEEDGEELIDQDVIDLNIRDAALRDLELSEREAED